jgi:DNA-binding GntR family transcriptional regulator
MQDEPRSDGTGALRVSRESVTLRERATENLRQAIVERRFPPGKHLVERELCDLLGVSRTSVREALRHLESEQLIRMVPHKGPVVVSLSARDARDIYEVRAALEGLAGELFARRASDDDIARLRSVADELSKVAADLDADAILTIKARFYQIIFDGARNETCAQMIRSLNTRVSLFRRMSLMADGRSEAMMQEVYCIIEAVEARDAPAARKACEAHVDGAYRAVLPQLEDADEVVHETNGMNAKIRIP